LLPVVGKLEEAKLLAVLLGVCLANPCSEYSDCLSCVSDDRCGFSDRCISGTEEGPDDETEIIDSWNFFECPEEEEETSEEEEESSEEESFDVRGKGKGKVKGIKKTTAAIVVTGRRKAGRGKTSVRRRVRSGRGVRVSSGFSTGFTGSGFSTGGVRIRGGRGRRNGRNIRVRGGSGFVGTGGSGFSTGGFSGGFSGGFVSGGLRIKSGRGRRGNVRVVTGRGRVSGFVGTGVSGGFGSGVSGGFVGTGASGFGSGVSGGFVGGSGVGSGFGTGGVSGGFVGTGI